MRMTKQEIIDLLQNINQDCSNVQWFAKEDNIWVYNEMPLDVVLNDIADGGIYRIKDNAVKEITPDLLHKVFKHKTIKGCYTKINMITENRIYFNENDSWTIDSFNNTWQLVED